MGAVADGIKLKTMSKKKNKNEQLENGIIYEFVTNKNGVSIKKCCASCERHELHDASGPKRNCTLKGKIVDKSDCCMNWIISEQTNKIRLSK